MKYFLYGIAQIILHVYFGANMEAQSHVFDEVGEHLEDASSGARLANYLIDMVLFYLVFFAAMFMIGVLVGASGGSADFADFLESIPGKLLIYLFAFSLLVIFFTLIEGASKGRSVGKLITGTRAVKDDGSAISWKDALLRSLCRLIPFEVFSGFSGHPWHDSLTSTRVVRY